MRLSSFSYLECLLIVISAQVRRYGKQAFSVRDCLSARPEIALRTQGCK